MTKRAAQHGSAVEGRPIVLPNTVAIAALA